MHCVDMTHMLEKDFEYVGCKMQHCTVEEGSLQGMMHRQAMAGDCTMVKGTKTEKKRKLNEAEITNIAEVVAFRQSYAALHLRALLRISVRN